MWEKLEGNMYIESLYWQELKVINRKKAPSTRHAASNAAFTKNDKPQHYK